jgi:hypothetical protein
VPAGGVVTVDGKQNGGITIKGWERTTPLVAPRSRLARRRKPRQTRWLNKCASKPSDSYSC